MKLQSASSTTQKGTKMRAYLATCNSTNHNDDIYNHGSCGDCNETSYSL